MILTLAAGTCVVDITHEVEPQQIMEAALTLEAAAPCFPPGSIHVAVVDPGVGTARRGIVVASAGQFFVGPDNGLFTPMLRSSWSAFELTAPEYRRPVVSRTFHGRDIFAPAAAYLALGVRPERFGPPVADPVRLAWPEAKPTPLGIRGEVIHVDRFGNLVTSVSAEQVGSLAAAGPVVVQVAGHLLPLVGTYGELPPGGAGALIGSRGRLEVAVREGSAARRLAAERGTPVLVRPRSRTARARTT